MKPVVILGKQPDTLPLVPFDNPDVEIWAFNNTGLLLGRIDVLFQMHAQEEYEGYVGHLEWLKANKTIPVYMSHHREDFPMCRVYPFEEVFGLTTHVLQGAKTVEKLRFFTSSIALAIALAVLQNRPKIMVYGVELKKGTEYWKQRDCFSFWIGFAGGRGIDLEIRCADDIFKKPLYLWPNRQKAD